MLVRHEEVHELDGVSGHGPRRSRVEHGSRARSPRPAECFCDPVVGDLVLYEDDVSGTDCVGSRGHRRASLKPIGSRHHNDQVGAVIGDTEFVVVRPHHRVELHLEAGRTFSVLALHGPCSGVHVSGSRWALDDAVLAPTEARGLSNVAEGTVSIAVSNGVLTVVVP